MSVELNQNLKTILVVEDSDDTRTVICHFLEIKGYRVLEGTNGEEALAVALRDRPDLILMDLHMPVLDGFMATRLIREFDFLSMIPVVALTAHEMRGLDFRNNVDELGLGHIEYLNKPVDFDQLEELVCRLLDSLTEEKAEGTSQKAAG